MKNKKIILSVLAAMITISIHAQTLKDATHLTDNEQYDAAASAFRHLISMESSNGTNYYYFGENYLLSDNADSALLMYTKGKRVDPNNVLNIVGEAKYRLNKYGVAEMKVLSERALREAAKSKKEFETLQNKTPEDQARLIGEMNAKAGDALAKYEEAKANVVQANILIDEALSKAGPKNSQTLIEAADALIKFKNKNPDKAKTLLDKAVVLDPKNPEIQILYGDIYSELNNGTLAAEYYNKALELDKNSVKAIVSKGRLYKRSTNYEGAAEEFQDAIKIDSTFAPARRELGEVYFKLGKLEKAKAEYRKYLELSKNNMRARIRIATLLYLSKDYNGAINEINQLSKMDENNITLLRVASYCYYETKEYTKGLSVAEQLFSKLDPDKITAIDYEYYGKLLSANNQDSVAVIQLQKAYELDSTRTDLLSEIGFSYYKLKKYPEAISYYQEKINSGKGIKVADYYNLGRSYLYNSDFVKADSAFMKVNELAPSYASGFLNRARANTYIDSTSEMGMAKPFYEKYIELVTADTTGKIDKKSLIEPYRYMAHYYVLPESKDYGKAEEYLQKILAIEPEDKQAIDGIDALRKQKKKP